MQKLKHTNPQRLFTFGCSFTDYKWATWANILAFEFNCQFFNFGKSGAGNAFISNQITQANRYYNFNENDIVIACWTNISREDRWKNKKGWVTPGNIYSQQEYDAKFVRSWANDIHFALRDFSYIDLIKNYLYGKTNYHFLSMCDIKNHINQWETGHNHCNRDIDNLTNLYKDSLDSISPSFYETLWQNDIDIKWKKDWKEIHPNYSDGHPTILEHYEYLTKTFDFGFSKRTIDAVNSLHVEWKEYIKEGYKKTKRSYGLHDMPKQWVADMHNNFRLKKELPMPHQLYH
jgi:hypothetical protein